MTKVEYRVRARGDVLEARASIQGIDVEGVAFLDRYDSDFWLLDEVEKLRGFALCDLRIALQNVSSAGAVAEAALKEIEGGES